MKNFTSHGFMLWAVPRFHREPVENKQLPKVLSANNKGSVLPKEVVLTTKQDFSASPDLLPAG